MYLIANIYRNMNTQSSLEFNIWTLSPTLRRLRRTESKELRPPSLEREGGTYCWVCDTRPGLLPRLLQAALFPSFKTILKLKTRDGIHLQTEIIGPPICVKQTFDQKCLLSKYFRYWTQGTFWVWSKRWYYFKRKF